MVRVRILEVIEHGFSTAFVRHEPGDVAEVPADLAARWLDAGRIEILPPLPPPEPPRTPVVEAVELPLTSRLKVPKKGR